MPRFSVFPIEISPVAVLVPPGPLVRHGTVGNCDIIVSVLSGERASLVIAEGVPCKKDVFVKLSDFSLFCQHFLDI